MCAFFPYICCATQFNEKRVEIRGVSRATFDKLVPFYVVEQSSRACLCDVCYKAKLITIALTDFWPTLHCGPTPGSPCTCECDLCGGNAGCKDYLPHTSSKAVYSMGPFSDAHMCEKEYLYNSSDGTKVSSHRSTCVNANCPDCRAKQDRVFSCPRKKGGLLRQLYPVPSSRSGIPPRGEGATPPGRYLGSCSPT